jgi:hypothetical protein
MDSTTTKDESTTFTLSQDRAPLTASYVRAL